MTNLTGAIRSSSRRIAKAQSRDDPETPPSPAALSGSFSFCLSDYDSTARHFELVVCLATISHSHDRCGLCRDRGLLFPSDRAISLDGPPALGDLGGPEWSCPARYRESLWRRPLVFLW